MEKVQCNNTKLNSASQKLTEQARHQTACNIKRELNTNRPKMEAGNNGLVECIKIEIFGLLLDEF